MRLLTVGSLPPEWGGPTRGGVATFHGSLLSGLLERREEVEVIGTLPPTPLSREIPVPAFVRPEDVLRAAFYEDLLQQLRPDAVLMNHIAHTYGVTHASLDAAPPAVGVIHSWHAVTFRSGEESRQAWETTAATMRGMGALAMPSHHALTEGLELGFRYPLVVETIHNPLQPLFMADDIDVSARERRGVLYLGSLVPRKAPAVLVEAAALRPETEVTLIGEGELEAELSGLIVDLGLVGRVRLSDPLSEADHLAQLRSRLLDAAVLCLPSRSESFGLAFIEALACGTPVVGYGPVVCEIRDAMGIEIGEPLEEGSAEEVATAIERVASRAWDRDLLRRATLDAFSLSRATDRYLELLRRVVSSGGNG